MSTVRLTVAQALVRFLANQYSERDGVQQRLIPGCWGIFGHGNVAGVAQALLEAQTTGSADLPYYLARNEQVAGTLRDVGFNEKNIAPNRCPGKADNNTCPFNAFFDLFSGAEVIGQNPGSGRPWVLPPEPAPAGAPRTLMSLTLAGWVEAVKTNGGTWPAGDTFQNPHQLVAATMLIDALRRSDL